MKNTTALMLILLALTFAGPAKSFAQTEDGAIDETLDVPDTPNEKSAPEEPKAEAPAAAAPAKEPGARKPGKRRAKSREVREAKEVLVKIAQSRTGKAIINFEAGFNPQPGEVYTLKRSEVAAGDLKVFEESRDHILGIQFSLSFLTDKPQTGDAVTRNSVNTSVKYGWNRQSYEWGPILTYQFTRNPTTDDTEALLGLFFDWNFNPNNVRAVSVLGLRLTAQLGTQDNSAQSKGASLNQESAGVVWKYFGLSNNFGLDFNVAYQISSSSVDNAKTTTSGVVALLGIQTYF